ncbi:MAG: TonB C-terminal domain-containing protein [Acidiferrobacterales bacterium]
MHSQIVRPHIEPDGRLSRIRLDQGSGYALLDESAWHSLERITHFPDAIFSAAEQRSLTFRRRSCIGYSKSERTPLTWVTA